MTPDDDTSASPAAEAAADAAEHAVTEVENTEQAAEAATTAVSVAETAHAEASQAIDTADAAAAVAVDTAETATAAVETATAAGEATLAVAVEHETLEQRFEHFANETRGAIAHLHEKLAGKEEAPEPSPEVVTVDDSGSSSGTEPERETSPARRHRFGH